MPTGKREVVTIDAAGQVLGRLSTQIAGLLRGKGKIGFTYNEDWGDKVVVMNCKQIRVTGNKANTKMYYRHSGYPGGLSSRTMGERLDSSPGELLRDSVAKMLPNNRLRKSWLKRLIISRENG